MPATALDILGIAPLQKQPRLLVAFLLQIMEQLRVCAARELAGEAVNSFENGQQIGLRFRRRHAFNGGIQFNKRLQNSIFCLVHNPDYQ